MKIYTKLGDQGKTGLIMGSRVDKDDLRIECNGLLDEVNAFIGLLKVTCGASSFYNTSLPDIQRHLMTIMSYIATPAENRPVRLLEPVDEATVQYEHIIDLLTGKMAHRNAFVLPGGNEVSALCHIIRTKIRTVERRVVTLQKQLLVDEMVIRFLNRLSDLFFVLAKYELNEKSIQEE